MVVDSMGISGGGGGEMLMIVMVVACDHDGMGNWRSVMVVEMKVNGGYGDGDF